MALIPKRITPMNNWALNKNINNTLSSKDTNRNLTALIGNNNIVTSSSWTEMNPINKNNRIDKKIEKEKENKLDDDLNKIYFSLSVKSSNVSDSFFHSMQPIIFIAQLFSLLPVQGILGKDSSKIKFSWFNFRVLYGIIMLFGSFSMIIFSTLRVIEIVPTYKHASGVMFHTFTTIILILFFYLAVKWPLIIHKWETVEKELAHYGYPKGIAWRVKGITTFILLSSLIEHVLSNIKQVRHSLICNKNNWIKKYFISYYPQVFNYVPYNPFGAFCVIIVKFVATFSWNFLDLFIIIISLEISEKFKQINKQMSHLDAKNVPEVVWRRIRMDYNILSILTKDIDMEIAPIVLLSFGNNLYFICLQLLNTINTMSYFDTIYFYWSFLYLIIRGSLVSLFGARIHEESLKPSKILYSVPSECYNIEVERFIQQVTTDHIAITGMRFFSLTRNLLLSIAGTIVTYEIVLYQMGSSVDNVSVNENNSTTMC